MKSFVHSTPRRKGGKKAHLWRTFGGFATRFPAKHGRHVHGLCCPGGSTGTGLIARPFWEEDEGMGAESQGMVDLGAPTKVARTVTLKAKYSIWVGLLAQN